MRTQLLPISCALLASLLPGRAQAQTTPYDFSAMDTLLQNELSQLNGHVAVIIRQGEHELYRFQAGDIDYDTKTRLASMTKTISAGVILSLVEDGTLSVDQRLGDTLPGFAIPGMGEATVADCWGMRHGIDSLVQYESNSNFTLAQSVALIGLFGYQHFRPGEMLGYDGSGMQSTGQIAALATGQTWEDMARARIFDLCNMPQADFKQFDPNPAVAGGMRASADEIMNYTEMIMNEGVYGANQVLASSSIERMFTNSTLDLPTHNTPFPSQANLYPYNQEPDYGFGSWIFAQHPMTGHVEEIVGAGAWGSYVWIDRRRELTATLITDVPAGSTASFPAAMGMMQISRAQIDGAQVQGLTAIHGGTGTTLLQWQKPTNARGTLIYGSHEPIRNVFQLRDAQLIGRTAFEQATVPTFPYYAATARFASLENRALTPRLNTVEP